MISTVRDLERFDLSLKSGVMMRPEWRTLRVDAAERRATASRCRTPTAGSCRTTTAGAIVWQYGVSDNASSSMIITLPQRGLTLILLANSQGLARPFDLSAGDVTVSPFARLFLSIFQR